MMDTRSRTQIHGVTADHEVTLTVHGKGSDTWQCLTLPGEVTLFFEGEGDENLHNVLGFLDRLHAIRNALVQDQVWGGVVAS
jgi:hypothetical protein